VVDRGQDFRVHAPLLHQQDAALLAANRVENGHTEVREQVARQPFERFRHFLRTFLLAAYRLQNR